MANLPQRLAVEAAPCEGDATEYGMQCRACGFRPAIEAAIVKAIEAAALKAKTYHDFGPSSRCPDCGNGTHGFRMYELGVNEAARRIRALITDEETTT